MKDYGVMSYEEIAKVLKITPRQVKMIEYRALRKLKLNKKAHKLKELLLGK